MKSTLKDGAGKNLLVESTIFTGIPGDALDITLFRHGDFCAKLQQITMLHISFIKNSHQPSISNSDCKLPTATNQSEAKDQ